MMENNNIKSGDIFDYADDPGRYLVIISEADSRGDHCAMMYSEDGSTTAITFDGVHIDHDKWKKRMIRPQVPVVGSPIMYISNEGFGQSWRDKSSIIKINESTGEAWWLEDGFPLTTEERAQLWDESE